jgi:hypothetical protein
MRGVPGHNSSSFVKSISLTMVLGFFSSTAFGAAHENIVPAMINTLKRRITLAPC